MLADGRLGHPELLGDQHAADAVGNEIADAAERVQSARVRPGQFHRAALSGISAVEALAIGAAGQGLDWPFAKVAEGDSPNLA